MIRRCDVAVSKKKENNGRDLISASAGQKPDFGKEAIFDTITDMLSKLLDMPKTDFSLDTMLFEDLPLDSLQLYELVVDLESLYDIHISDEAIELVRSIGDVVEMISNSKN